MNKYFIGIDIGSTCAKTVVMNHEKEILHRFLQPTGWSSVDTAKQIQETLMEKGILPEESVVVATGYGRVSVPYAAKCVTEITCHAKGACYIHKNENMLLIDIGGQDTKIIRIENGMVTDFLMNDKCSAGTGRFLGNGGILIIGCRSGYKQENGKCVMLPQPGLLQKITGSDVRDFTFTSPAEPSVTANWDGQTIDMPIFNDIMEPVEEGETLAFYDNSYYAGKPAVIRKNTGKGYAIHFGSTFSRESMKVLLEYTGILEPFQAMLEAPQEVEVIQRVKGNKKYFFVLNYMGSEQKIVLKKQMRSLYDNVIANGEICMKPYETIVYEVLE